MPQGDNGHGTKHLTDQGQVGDQGYWIMNMGTATHPCQITDNSPIHLTTYKKYAQNNEEFDLRPRATAFNSQCSHVYLTKILGINVEQAHTTLLTQWW